MKILFLNQFPLFGNGSGNYTRKLAEQLVEEGHEVAIATPGQAKLTKIKVFIVKTPRQAVFVSHPEWKRAKSYRQLTAQEFTKIYLTYLKELTKIVESFQPDVIHVNHTFFLTWIANFLHSFYGIGYVVTAHGTDILQVSQDKRYYALTAYGLKSASSIIAVSTHTRKWLLKVFKSQGLNRKTRVITGGIDLKNWHHKKPIRIIKHKYNLEGKKVVIFVGRLTKEKGVNYLIQAAKKINAEIFIIGGGVEKKSLIDYANKKQAKNIHFLGYFGKEYLEELREFYRLAKVLIFPSVWDEPLGLVALEAMASYTPVVASKKGGIPLAVKDGYNGFLIRARSARLIAEKVNFLLSHEDKQKEFGEHARKFIEERFDWKVISPKIIALYEQAYKETTRYRKKNGFNQRELELEQRELSKKIGYV